MPSLFFCVKAECSVCAKVSCDCLVSFSTSSSDFFVSLSMSFLSSSKCAVHFRVGRAYDRFRCSAFWLPFFLSCLLLLFVLRFSLSLYRRCSLSVIPIVLFRVTLRSLVDLVVVSGRPCIVRRWCSPDITDFLLLSSLMPSTISMSSMSIAKVLFHVFTMTEKVRRRNRVHSCNKLECWSSQTWVNRASRSCRVSLSPLNELGNSPTSSYLMKFIMLLRLSFLRFSSSFSLRSFFTSVVLFCARNHL